MKRFMTVFLAAILILAMVPGAVYAFNEEPSSLTVIMRADGELLDGITVAVCLVADAAGDDNNIVYLAAPTFSGAGADFTNLTKEKNIALAATLDAYAVTNGIARSVKVTDIDGRAAYPNLTPGLYLVAQTDAESSEYIIAPYLVTVPSQHPTRDGWEYNVTAYPKSEPVKRSSETPPTTTTGGETQPTTTAGDDTQPTTTTGGETQSTTTAPPVNDLGRARLHLSKYLYDADGNRTPAGYGKWFAVRVYNERMELIERVTLQADGSDVTVHGLEAGQVYYVAEEPPLIPGAFELMGYELTTNTGRNGTSDREAIAFTISDIPNDQTFDIYIRVDNRSDDFILLPDDPPLSNPPVFNPDDIPIVNIVPLGPGPSDRNDDGPKTNDTNNIQQWIILIAFGCAGLFAVILIANAKRISRISGIFSRR